jgi:hypothetical protein
MGAKKAYGGTATPFKLMSPVSFVSKLFLFLSVLAGVGHNHRQERRNCKSQVGVPRGNNNTTLFTFATLTYLAFQIYYLSPYADIAMTLYLHRLTFCSFHFLYYCLAVSLGDHESRSCWLPTNVEDI